MKPLIFLAIIFSFNFAHAEIKFESKKIKISKKIIIVEIADSAEKHQRGLMFRKKLETDRGMLFIFENSQRRSFWMKNTFIPLTIGYFDENKTLVETIDMKPVTSEMELDPPSYPSQKSAMFALEMNKDWFKKNNIKIGDRFTFL